MVSMSSKLLLTVFILFLIVSAESRILRSHSSEGKFHVKVQNICKILWDSDFKLMSLVLEKQLPRLLENCNNFHNSTGITIFVPSDNAVYDYLMNYDLQRGAISLEYQIMTLKLDRKAFELRNPEEKLELPTCSPNFTVGNNHRFGKDHFDFVTHWDIYNDGSVAVHGVDEFFRIYWYKMLFSVRKSWLPDEPFFSFYLEE